MILIHSLICFWNYISDLYLLCSVVAVFAKALLREEGRCRYVSREVSILLLTSIRITNQFLG